MTGSEPAARRAVLAMAFLLGLMAAVLALARLHATLSDIVVTPVWIGDTPATVYRRAGAPAAPVVVIAHGFAGSQQLMQSFAVSMAHDGYIAVTFDFPGHGRNPVPLSGSITEETGATRVLVANLAEVAAYARSLGNGQLAVLGHSMASDIVVRYAESNADVDATIAVSMFSPAVTATAPRNLLIIVGDWEPFLKGEALRAVAPVAAPAQARPGVTYGDIATGGARRATFSPHVEHASVLYSTASQREAVLWLDQVYRVARPGTPWTAERGPWIVLLILGTVLLGAPLARCLPRVATPAIGAGRPWRRLWLPLVLPMIATPMLLRVLPTHFLPVLVGDYVAIHFLVYGLLTAACLRLTANRTRASVPRLSLRLWLAASLVTGYGFVAIVAPLDRYVTSFVPGPGRLVLVLVMLSGTLTYFLSDEWLTRGPGSGRGAYAASKVAFLASLAVAVALDFERLFFLIIIIPVILLFFVVYGLCSRWAYRATGHPWAAGIANGIAFAWAIGVTFPLLAG